MVTKQKVITVISSLERATKVPVVDELAKEGWIIKQVSTSSFDANKSKTIAFTKPSLAITLLLEKEE